MLAQPASAQRIPADMTVFLNMIRPLSNLIDGISFQNRGSLKNNT
jgi:hypothetical protein